MLAIPTLMEGISQDYIDSVHFFAKTGIVAFSKDRNNY